MVSGFVRSQLGTVELLRTAGQPFCAAIGPRSPGKDQRAGDGQPWPGTCAHAHPFSECRDPEGPPSSHPGGGFPDQKTLILNPMYFPD